MKRNGARFGFDLRSDMLRGVRHDASGLRGATRPLDPSLEGEAATRAHVIALRELADELQVGRHDVDFTVPRAEAIEKQLLLPKVAPHELEPLVRFQLAKDLPFELDALTLAWQRLPTEGASSLTVQCLAVRVGVVEGVQGLARQAGLRPGRILVASHAAARGLTLAGAKGRALLLDVTAEGTDIIIVADGALRFSRTSSIGPGQDGWQERLAGELNRTLIAAEAECGGPPESFYLTGIEDADLSSRLAKSLALSPTPLGPAGDASRLVAARGLADPSPVPGPLALDLAHAARTRAARNRKQQLIAVGAAALLLLVAAFAMVRANIESRREAVALLRDERSRLAPRARAAASIEHELKQAEAWTSRKGRELEILLAVTRALPEDDAYLTQLRWSEDGELQLAGRAKEWETVGRFFAALDQDPMIESADFADVRRPREKGALGYVFTGSASLVARGAP